MSHDVMPDRLPESFREVWLALKDADEASPSRQGLAHRLGISTHTIQRILVSGEVPAFPETGNTRIVRAWARILTRLAHHLGRQPREWIEMVGIAWDEDIRKASEVVLENLLGRSYGQRPAPAAEADSFAVSPAGPAWPDCIRIGVVQRPPFSESLSTQPWSFMETYARRLVGAIAPGGKLRLQDLDEQATVLGLTQTRPSLDLGVGVIETVHRRSLGLEFVAVPGWHIRLSAVCINQRDGSRQMPGWDQVISSVGSKDLYYMVRGGDVAEHFLMGQCGVPTERLLVRPTRGEDETARVLFRETRRREEDWVILVDEHETCLDVIEELELQQDFTKSFSARELVGAPDECPTYRLGVAVRPRASGWRNLIGMATDDELFGTSLNQTARLYADLMTAGNHLRPDVEPGRPDRYAAPVRPVAFEQASPVFQREVCRGIIRILAGWLAARPETRRGLTSDDAIESRSFALATASARTLIPDEWLPALEGEQERLAPRKAAIPEPAHCRSCSVSLISDHNRGVSDCYCRYCSDEEGRLKPRGEVRELIAHWFEEWQGDISHEEAVRRAKIFMEAMPAWSNN
jgi:hypothetical protein